MADAPSPIAPPPHLPQALMGIHCGPVIGGVVGVKLPRCVLVYEVGMCTLTSSPTPACSPVPNNVCASYRRAPHVPLHPNNIYLFRPLSLPRRNPRYRVFGDTVNTAARMARGGGRAL